MSLDFPTLLVLGTLVTGLAWAADALLWAPKRRVAAERAKTNGADEESVERIRQEPIVVEYARSFFPIILLVLVVRSFGVEPFRIPSGSMLPTLKIGDFILVNKFTYGLRLPVLHNEVVDFGEPERGDIVVFRYPEDPDVDYIKRVVGVPGDRIAYRDKTLYINGERADQESLGTYVGQGGGAAMTGASLRREDLAGLEHRILVMDNGYRRDFEYRVPARQYFVMGDNRDNSKDSRYWGTVPEANLVGKAMVVWMNWDSAAGGVDWSRIGTVIE